MVIDREKFSSWVMIKPQNERDKVVFMSRFGILVCVRKSEDGV